MNLRCIVEDCLWLEMVVHMMVDVLMIISPKMKTNYKVNTNNGFILIQHTSSVDKPSYDTKLVSVDD